MQFKNIRSVAKIWSLGPAAFVLKLLRDWTRNRALTDDIARKIKIYFLNRKWLRRITSHDFFISNPDIIESWR